MQLNIFALVTIVSVTLSVGRGKWSFGMTYQLYRNVTAFIKYNGSQWKCVVVRLQNKPDRDSVSIY